MPYGPNEVPTVAKNFKVAALELFKRVFNATFKSTKNEDTARRAALRAVERKYPGNEKFNMAKKMKQDRGASEIVEDDNEVLSNLEMEEDMVVLGPLIGEIPEGEQSKEKWYEIAKVGDWPHPYYGVVHLDEDMFDEMVFNFYSDVLQKEIFVDENHKKDKAVAWYKALRREGDKLLAKLDWTSLGKQLVGDGIYKYFSIMYRKVFKSGDNSYNNVLTGGGITNFPTVKGLRALTLSEFNDAISLEEGDFEDDIDLGIWGQIISELSKVDLRDGEITRVFGDLSWVWSRAISEDAEGVVKIFRDKIVPAIPKKLKGKNDRKVSEFLEWVRSKLKPVIGENYLDEKGGKGIMGDDLVLTEDEKDVQLDEALGINEIELKEDVELAGIVSEAKRILKGAKMKWRDALKIASGLGSIYRKAKRSGKDVVSLIRELIAELRRRFQNAKNISAEKVNSFINWAKNKADSVGLEDGGGECINMAEDQMENTEGQVENTELSEKFKQLAAHMSVVQKALDTERRRNDSMREQMLADREEKRHDTVQSYMEKLTYGQKFSKDGKVKFLPAGFRDMAEVVLDAISKVESLVSREEEDVILSSGQEGVGEFLKTLKSNLVVKEKDGDDEKEVSLSEYVFRLIGEGCGLPKELMSRKSNPGDEKLSSVALEDNQEIELDEKTWELIDEVNTLLNIPKIEKE